jgi:hypothetical protein
VAIARAAVPISPVVPAPIVTVECQPPTPTKVSALDLEADEVAIRGGDDAVADEAIRPPRSSRR